MKVKDFHHYVIEKLKYIKKWKGKNSVPLSWASNAKEQAIELVRLLVRERNRAMGSLIWPPAKCSYKLDYKLTLE